jgi:hypothetical protein
LGLGGGFGCGRLVVAVQLRTSVRDIDTRYADLGGELAWSWI